MATNLDASAILTGKRKRATISYAEEELDVLADIDDPDDGLMADESFEDIDDINFGSRKASITFTSPEHDLTGTAETVEEAGQQTTKMGGTIEAKGTEGFPLPRSTA